MLEDDRDYKLDCVAATIAATITDVISLLQQINKVWSAWYAAIDLAHMFFSISIRKEDQKQRLEWTGDYIINLNLGLY